MSHKGRQVLLTVNLPAVLAAERLSHQVESILSSPEQGEIAWASCWLQRDYCVPPGPLF